MIKEANGPVDPPDCRIEFVCGTGAVTNSSRPQGRRRGSSIQIAVERQAAGEGITLAQHLIQVLAANLSTLGLLDRLGVQRHRCASINLKRAGARVSAQARLVPADRRVARQLERRLPVRWQPVPARRRRRWRIPRCPCRLDAPAHSEPNVRLASAWRSVVIPHDRHCVL